MNSTRWTVPALLLALCLAAARVPSQDAGETRQAGPFTIVKELPRRPSVDQGSTGTCWCFATTSFLETEVERQTGKAVDLSEMFIVREAILEKARRYVALQGKTQFGEGGLSHDVSFLAARHGLVPAEAYPGRPAGQPRHDHEELFRILTTMLKELAAEGKPAPSARWEAAVAGVVDAYLGTPPREVEAEGRTLTPQEYSRDVLRLRFDDYVEVMSYGYAPYHATAELLVPDNWLHFGGYRNVPLDEFMAGIDGALERGFSVAVDIDVSEPGFQSRRGTAKLVPDALEEPGAITAAVRDGLFSDRSTTDDHLMHIVGLAKDAEGRRVYLTKDSGGPGRGPYEGHTFISANYLRAKALGYMVHKDALEPKR